jgi:hypothetical protein
MKCGAKLVDGAEFCTNCGEKIETVPQNIIPDEPHKTNARLWGIIIAVIAIVIIVLFIVFLLSDGLNSQFVGTWEYGAPESGLSAVYKFNSDGSLEAGLSGFTFKVGTWSVEGNQLCFHVSQGIDLGEVSMGNQCFAYRFSEGGTKLTLTATVGAESSSLTLTKK